MEKIIVNPGKVRGYGNIISPKKLDDYAGYHNELNMSTETVDGEELSVINPRARSTGRPGRPPRGPARGRSGAGAPAERRADAPRAPTATPPAASAPQ